MAQRPLHNYLRTHRRRAGLSQKEVASLLGVASGAKVSRYENFARMPSVRTVFAYELIFDRPASELFAGIYDETRLALRPRAKLLLERLIAVAPDKRKSRAIRKLELLRAIVDSKPSSTGHR